MAKRNGLRVCVTLMDFWYLCPRFTLLRSDGGLCEGPPDGGIGCVSCHAGYSAEHGGLVLPATGSGLCYACHDL